ICSSTGPSSSRVRVIARTRPAGATPGGSRLSTRERPALGPAELIQDLLERPVQVGPGMLGRDPYGGAEPAAGGQLDLDLGALAGEFRGPPGEDPLGLAIRDLGQPPLDLRLVPVGLEAFEPLELAPLRFGIDPQDLDVVDGVGDVFVGADHDVLAGAVSLVVGGGGLLDLALDELQRGG